MSDEKGYNGWTNYETWNLALWIDNEQGTQEYWRDRAEEAYRDAKDTPSVNAKLTASEPFTRAERAMLALADALKDDTEENSPTVVGFYADVLSAAISEVNYHEIASHWVEEVATEIDAEEKQERIDELEFELTDAHEGEGNDISFEDWLSAMASNDDGTLQEAAKELIGLRETIKK